MPRKRIIRFLEILTVLDNQLVSDVIVTAKLVADRSRQSTLVHADWCGFRLPGAESETQICHQQQQQQ